MKIVFIQSSPYPGTASTAYMGYASSLRKIGHEVVVICMSVTVADSHQVVNVNGVRVHQMRARKLSKMSLDILRFGLFVNRVLKEEDMLCPIDICQFKAFPNCGPFLVPMARMSKAKIVLDVRSLAISSRLNNIISKYVVRVQKLLVDHVFVLDDRLVVEIYGKKEDSSISILNLGFDLDQYESKKEICSGELEKIKLEYEQYEGLVFVYVGALGCKRNILKFAEAFFSLCQEGYRIRLHLFGQGDQVEAISRLSTKLDLEESLKYFGSIAHEKIPIALKYAEVGVSYIPDIDEYRYQPPTKTIEYLAAGLIVLGTDTPGNRKFLNQESNGFLFKDNREDIKKSILSVWKHWEENGCIEKRIPKYVEFYDYMKIVEREMLPVYQKILYDD